ncbi:nuclease HARBI1 [Solea senegalensis]|uniref:Nuclease HARBI1 n=1 Tax=Solea senegalensis TaxID=28829 RepID=A0AAV6QEJ5_SOLSE|nr:nuclease HARBI1 [Solea senegalensis]
MLYRQAEQEAADLRRRIRERRARLQRRERRLALLAYLVNKDRPQDCRQHDDDHSPDPQKRCYMNRKLFPSVILQGVCDAGGKFRDVYIGNPGSVHDSMVLRRSPMFRQALYPPAGYFLLGDGGYPCLQHPVAIMTPYRQPVATRVESRFNHHHAKARIIIERTFGMLKTRWRNIFLRALEVRPLFTPKVIGACCILHNICMGVGDIVEEEEEEEDDDGSEDGGNGEDEAPVTDSIYVEFEEITEFTRRPIGHTGGKILHKADTFENFPDFHSEFNAILESNVWTVNAMVAERYQIEKAKAKAAVQNIAAVTLTADMWTSMNMDAYLAVTSHYIDKNTCLQSALLGAVHFPLAHTAENLARVMTSLMEEWGITSKTTCLVTDGATNMIACGGDLRLRHAICIAHVQNLIVKKAVDQNPVLFFNSF